MEWSSSCGEGILLSVDIHESRHLIMGECWIERSFQGRWNMGLGRSEGETSRGGDLTRLTPPHKASLYTPHAFMILYQVTLRSVEFYTYIESPL